MSAPFNGDVFIAAEVLRLRDKRGITRAVETGTYMGHTSRWLAQNFQKVWTVESRSDFFTQSGENLRGIENLTRFCGNSVETIGALGREIIDGAFVYLDAHWGYEWPLQSELSAIAQCGAKPVILIHDFCVPGSNLGFDSYGGHRLDLEYVTPGMDAIYGAGQWEHHYNDAEHAGGSRRGVLYVEPV